MSTLPYNQALEQQDLQAVTDGGLSESIHNGLGFSGLEHPENAGLAQRLEHLAYTEGVGGSNPSACTITLTKGFAALVSPEDFERVSSLKWYSQIRRPGLGPYAVRFEGRKPIYMHRFILAAPRGLDVDHVDGDGLNNVRSNIRVASRSQNNGNTSARRGRQYKGAYKRLGYTYSARIQGRHIGNFPTEEQAARAYDSEALKIWGEFARLNFPILASALRPGA